MAQVVVNFFRRYFVWLLIAALVVPGCGYATKPSLPANIKSVYVAPVKNTIDLTTEISDQNRFRVYRPGLEVELTDAIINQYILDGNLKIGKPDEAEAVLETKLISFTRDPLRYSSGNSVQEYRLSVTIEGTLIERRTRKVLWRASIAGDSSYLLEGSRAESEDQAIGRVVLDTARRVVEQTMELW